MASSGWQVATISATRNASPRVKLFELQPTSPVRFTAGQHIDIRLTAPDGYQAQRSYSISSDPAKDDEIELAIEKIEDGEVSSYLHDYGSVGIQVEIRGPIGGPFSLNPNYDGSVLFIAGGIGIAPLMSMLRLRKSTVGLDRSVLLYSVRTEDDLVFGDELFEMAKNDLLLIPTLTRDTPDGWTNRSENQVGRFRPDTLNDLFETHSFSPDRTYLCGGTEFVESLSSGLVDIGIDPTSIRTERFGP